MCDEQWFVISVNSFWIRLERVALGVSVICKWTVNYNKFRCYFYISLTIDDFWLNFVAIFRATEIMEFYWNKLFANAYVVSMRIFWKLPQLWQYANQRNIIIEIWNRFNGHLDMDPSKYWIASHAKSSDAIQTQHFLNIHCFHMNQNISKMLCRIDFLNFWYIIYSFALYWFNFFPPRIPLVSTCMFEGCDESKKMDINVCMFDAINVYII